MTRIRRTAHAMWRGEVDGFKAIGATFTEHPVIWASILVEAGLWLRMLTR